MARKLYIFNPTKRVRIDGAQPSKWVGGYSQSYAYLGDYQARLLGVGNHFSAKRLPAWLHSQPEGAKSVKVKGASRSDRDFRGWG